MSTINSGKTRDKIEQLDTLSRELYENIFKVSLIDNKDKTFYFYNTLNRVIFPDNIDKDVFDIKVLNVDTPWTTLSYQIYGSISLWWVIFLLNKPEYVFLAKAGKQYKYIKPGYMQSVLQNLKNE